MCSIACTFKSTGMCTLQSVVGRGGCWNKKSLSFLIYQSKVLVFNGSHHNVDVYNAKVMARGLTHTFAGPKTVSFTSRPHLCNQDLEEW